MNTTEMYTSIAFSFTSHSYAIPHYAICIVISWFRKNRHSKRGEGARRRPSEPGGSIIVRRLICLLYTAGGLLSGIPFYGIPTLYVEPACDDKRGTPLRTRHMLLHHVAHCRRGATLALCWVGTVSVGERWARRASWGALIAYHLTLSGQDLSLTACGLRHPAAGSRRDV